MPAYRESVWICACCKTDLEEGQSQTILHLPKGDIHLCIPCSNDHFNDRFRCITDLLIAEGWRPPPKSLSKKFVEFASEIMKHSIKILEAAKIIEIYSKPKIPKLPELRD
jgi:hypothetical protein